MEMQNDKQTMTRILLLEDDAGLIDGLEYSLRKNGFEVETVRTVAGALDRLFQSNSMLSLQSSDAKSRTFTDVPCRNDSASQYNLLLLDVTLPDGTGFEVCEQVRQHDRRIPIIFLTASDEEVNVIRGLDSGADDYITKPFKIGELCSRIRALLRRTAMSRQTPTLTLSGRQAQTSCLSASGAEAFFADTFLNAPAIPLDPERTLQTAIAAHHTETDITAAITSGSLTIDLLAGSVCLNGQTVDLTRAEYRLLTLLVRNAGRTITRELILNELWDSAGDFVDDNTLSVYMRRLREKIEADPSRPVHLITVRGFGYRWES